MTKFCSPAKKYIFLTLSSPTLSEFFSVWKSVRNKFRLCLSLAWAFKHFSKWKDLVNITIWGIETLIHQVSYNIKNTNYFYLTSTYGCRNSLKNSSETINQMKIKLLLQVYMHKQNVYRRSRWSETRFTGNSVLVELCLKNGTSPNNNFGAA